MSSFFAKRSQKHKKTVKLSVFFALLGSVRAKGACRTLAKLAQGKDNCQTIFYWVGLPWSDRPGILKGRDPFEGWQSLKLRKLSLHLFKQAKNECFIREFSHLEGRKIFEHKFGGYQQNKFEKCFKSYQILHYLLVIPLNKKFQQKN